MAPNTTGQLPTHSTVVLVRGDRVQVENGRTTRDSLIGTRPSGAHFAVHRDSVNFVEARKVSVIRSVGAGAGGLLVAFAVATVVLIGAALGELQ